MDAERLGGALRALGDVLRGQDFVLWQSSFLKEHAPLFSLEDENRLECTQIYQLYERGFEEHLVNALSSLDVTLGDLEATMLLPPDQSLGWELDAGAEEALSLILTHSSFLALKAAAQSEVLHRKQEEEHVLESLETLCSSSCLQIDCLAGIHQHLGVLGDNGRWTSAVDNDWMRLQYGLQHNDRNGEVYIRGAWVASLTTAECCDMLLTYTERRKTWDTNFRYATVEKGENLDSDDITLTAHFDLGSFLHLVGLPREACFRTIRMRHHPAPGFVTIASLPWKAKADCYDDKHQFLKWNVTVIRPHPADAAKSIISIMGKNNLGRLPKWVLRSVLTTLAPRIVEGMEARYISNVRNHGSVGESA